MADRKDPTYPPPPSVWRGDTWGPPAPRVPGADVTRRAATGRFLDPHELLKKQMFGAAGPSDDHFEKSRPSPYETYGCSDQYVVLDSFARVRDMSPARGTYEFNFMVQGEGRPQSIGATDKIDTVVEAQVAPFVVPLLPLNPRLLNSPVTNYALPQLIANGAPGTSTLGSGFTQLPFGGRVTMQLVEVGRQAVQGRGVRHHFEFDVLPYIAAQGTYDEITPYRPDIPAGEHFTGLRLVPLAEFSSFVFTDPIKDVHGLTVTFRNPDQTIVFPEDCYDNARAIRVVDGLNTVLVIELPGSNLAAGDRIYITGFDNYGVANAAVAGGPGTRVQSPVLNSWMNQPDGLVVGDAGLVAGVSFRLNADVGVADAPDPSAPSVTGPTPPAGAPGSLVASGFRVCIAKNRVRIPLRLRRVVPRLTNYKAV
jgi:hypothetical protein